MRTMRWVGTLIAIVIVLGLAACGDEDTPTTTPAPTTVPATTAPTQPAATSAPTEPASTPVLSTAPALSTPVADAAATTPVTGTLTLAGTEQVDFVLTDDGCVGLGEWRALKTGAQVVVRDASGTVTDVVALTAAPGDGCSWSFTFNAPATDYVSVSIPMVFEQWFAAADVATGTLEIALP